ncbi:ImmA/IrrE family metallo-endopeptidase [Krasilnikovia sp. MM14-A1259]|uniref:ImmA/IrrE family metallo-endopeptidase n=1 Tax=Krasilnikovia sp. MM14-A1259 TaxID=3373539 RepID=UPI00382582F6
MNWLIAHRVASIAAANLRQRLGLPEDGYVDLFAALRRSGLMVAGDEMPSLFGAYFPAGPGRNAGILLNSTMSEATIRHTGAHELGHAELGHERCLADGPDLFSGLPRNKWPDEEKQAEAFAAWFLMPIRAVKTILTRLGLDIPREAADVYQLSLHLGTSYRGAVRHLEHLRMAAPSVAAGWRRVQPARLRARLCGCPDQPPARVWDLTSLTDGSELHVEQGDRLIVRTPRLGGRPLFTGPAAVTALAKPLAVEPDQGIEFDIAGDIDTPSLLTVTSAERQTLWSGTLMPTPEDRRGLIAAAHKPLMVGPTNGARR